MAIPTNAPVDFFGTQTSVVGSGTIAAVADGDFSTINATTGLVAWTNTDNVKEASVTILANWTTTAPDANSSINLYLRITAVQSTNDDVAPDANFQHHYVGSFPLNDATGAQYVTIEISLPNAYDATIYEPYIENKSGSTEDLPADWGLWITPKSIGPKA